MSYSKLFLLLISSVVIFSENSIANSKTPPNALNTPIYLLKHTKCKYRPKDKTSYCVDKNNKKITGEIRKYADGKITLSIPVKDGLLEGTTRAFKRNGEKIYEKSYKNGKLNGLYDTFYDENKIETSTTYKNGLKEGIAKYYYTNGYIEKQLTYVENHMDGKMRTYDKSGKTVFDFITANDKIVKGVYYYLDKKDKVLTADLPQIIIDGLNEKCVILKNVLTANCYLIDMASDEDSDCNTKWLENNQKALELQVNKCKPKQ